jgi:hypothetical protein
MEVFFHLFYDMFCFKVMLNFKVCRRFDYLIGVPADRTEFPFLETIHVRESPAGRATDNEVHIKEVMSAVLIKIYLLNVKFQEAGVSKKQLLPVPENNETWRDILNGSETKLLYYRIVS